MDYMAPEYITTMSCDTASDMFSSGMLFYAVFSRGRPLFESRNEMSAYRSNIDKVGWLMAFDYYLCNMVSDFCREFYGFF